MFIILQIFPLAHTVLKIGEYISNIYHLVQNMLGYLSTGIICSEKRTLFRELSSRKTVSIEERMMSKDKFPSIFSAQMEAIQCLLSLKYFLQCVEFF